MAPQRKSDWERERAYSWCLENCGLADPDIVISVIAGVSLNLRYMDIIFKPDLVHGVMLNIEILRAKDGAYCGWREEGLPRPWGGFYIGAKNGLLYA